MRHPWLVIVGTALPTLLVAQTARIPETQTERGPYARIAIMRALDGHSVELETGYIRHLEWHRQAKDSKNATQIGTKRTIVKAAIS